jgi:iron complex outermembrane recepter protein
MAAVVAGAAAAAGADVAIAGTTAATTAPTTAVVTAAAGADVAALQILAAPMRIIAYKIVTSDWGRSCWASIAPGSGEKTMRASLQSATVRAVLILLAICAVPLAHAQSAFTFDLPAQPLADALRAVASATHIDIVFDPAIVAGIEAPPLKGSETARQALATLLARTGLRYVDVGRRTVRIARVVVRDPARAHEKAKAPASGSSGGASPQQAGGANAAPAGTAAPGATSSSSSPASGSSGPNGPATVERAELSEVVVTGTRIAGVVPVSPVITLDRTTIDESGYSSVGQLLLTLPENFSGGQNPGVVGARGNNQYSVSGASSANLFGLGADSTLTLVDGHRLAYDEFQNGVDLSLIPLAAVDRVEIMTDGASAIYGSDAVAGVVNVILKQHYNGVTADARYGDVTSGSASQAQYSILAGHDWDSGEAVIAYEYSHDSPLYASERPFSEGAEQPTTLYPNLNRDSAFLSAHQDLSTWLTASLDGLYTKRSDSLVSTGGPTDAETINYGVIEVKEYGITPSLTAALPGNWTLSLDGTIADDRDDGVGPSFSVSTDQLVRNPISFFQNDLRIGEVGATGPVLQLESGDVRLAVGAGYRHEGARATPLSPGEPMISAGRSIRYAYAEVEAPLVKPSETRTLLERLDLSAAVRSEHYSDFGTQTTPKVGISYIPVQSLRIRSTWAESFRAPEFADLYGARQLYLAPAAEAGGTPGTTFLFTAGVNPALGPETATSRTVGIDLTPPRIPALKVSATYFYVDYRNRIIVPISNLAYSLSNPLYAAFVTRNPTPAQQEALVASSLYFSNFTGEPYDPANVSAIVNNSYQNATLQRIHGVDLDASDRWPLLGGDLSARANAAWLTLRQQTISTEPAELISGTIFNPPDFKARASATWQRAGWGFTAAFNYVNSELNNANTPAFPVGSWSTVDVQVSYAFRTSEVWALRGLKASISVQNIFNRYPPFVAASATTYPGLGYDSTNASPFGRFISAYLSKSW